MATVSDPPAAIPHLSVAERVARGKAARAEVPRSSHAAFEPAPSRPDPVTVLKRQAKTRVPELVPIRYGRMLVSPFTFYRGAAMIMAGTWRRLPRSGLSVQCCGDAHLSNFGVFASPERGLMFDLNDFDETLPGPWEWDVKRLAVSMLIAARDNSFAASAQDQVVLDTVESYRTAMAEFAGMNNLDVWYSHLDIERALQELRIAAQSPRRSSAPRRRSPRRARRTACRRSPSSRDVVDGAVADRRRTAADRADRTTSSQGTESEEMFEGLHELLRSYRQTLAVRPARAAGASSS